MDTGLLLKGITKYIFGVLLVGILLFIPAGTFKYYNAWLFMGILFINMLKKEEKMKVKNTI